MPKTIQDLAKSRARRRAILAEFGCIPDSILVHNKGHRSMDLMVDSRPYGANIACKNQGITGKLADAFSASGTMRRGKGGTLSRFPQSVGRVLLLLYTKRGDIVCDPFAGHNSRMELCFRHGRHYYGNDLSADFMRANEKIAWTLLRESKMALLENDTKIKLTKGDSRKLPWKSNFGDFTITSPPYWDIEFYGDEPEQLGTGKSYKEFLQGLGQVACENFRVLKPGAFCVWCINDFRKDGKFYSYHEHTASLLRKAGFVQWDIAITDLGSSVRANFAQQIVDSKILPKRHEYCLVFRKPKAEK